MHPRKSIAALVVALVIGLAGCASLSVGPNATLQQRVAAARTDLATASLFVSLYASFPECGSGVPQPCSNIKVVELLEKGRIAALAALDAVDALLAAGSPEEKILVALQEAENAIRTLQGLKARTAAATTVQVAAPLRSAP